MAEHEDESPVAGMGTVDRDTFEATLRGVTFRVRRPSPGATAMANGILSQAQRSGNVGLQFEAIGQVMTSYALPLIVDGDGRHRVMDMILNDSTTIQELFDALGGEVTVASGADTPESPRPAPKRSTAHRGKIKKGQRR